MTFKKTQRDRRVSLENKYDRATINGHFDNPTPHTPSDLSTVRVLRSHLLLAIFIVTNDRWPRSLRSLNLISSLAILISCQTASTFYRPFISGRYKVSIPFRP